MSNSPSKMKLIKQKATRIRRHICTMTCKSASGHPGGSLSMTDLISCLYFGGILKYDAKNPEWEDRDYFVLSKGHAAPALYATLAECGFFPMNVLDTLREMGSPLQGHPDRRSVPGVEMSTGSLGQGLSVCVGIASGLRLDNKQNKVVCIMGDGEIQEGQVWEAAMCAAHYKLNNLIAVVDRNKLQIDGNTENVMALGDVAAKFEAFGWKTLSIDGHDYEQIIDAFDEKHKDDQKPLFILADTTKGKGVSFMENNVSFHGVAPTHEECNTALCELIIEE